METDVQHISEQGLNDLILSEGLKTRAYRDSVGVWTIGYGHAATSGRAPVPKAGMTITKAEAMEILKRDLAEAYEPAVRKALGPVPQNVFDGAVSFHFNTGGIAKASWVGKYKAGDMAGARKAFMQWRKPPEIVGRRTREAGLIFDGKYHSKPVSGTPQPTITNVHVYQDLLDRLGYYDGPIDGIRGPRTVDAIKAFQRAKKLKVDGIVGPETMFALESAQGQKTIPVLPEPPAPPPRGVAYRFFKGIGGSDRLS